MPIPTYTPGYPPDGSSLGQTKATIRNNLDGTFQTLNVDHVNNNGQPGSRPAGYHTIIHEVPQTSVTTVTGYNQLFCGVPGTLAVDSVTTPNVPPNGDTQLYSLTGMGGLSQLTGNSASQNGYSWSGGILFQWGFVAQTSSSTVAVTFPVTFPRNFFNVQVTRTRASTSPGDNSMWVITTPTTSGFSIKNDDGHMWGYYWFAIGN
jgi:hypothetical protein